MSDAELAAAMRFGDLDARDRARIEAEADRRDLLALLDRIRPQGRLTGDLLAFSDDDLAKAFGHVEDDGDRLRIMAEMDRRDVAASLPGVRGDLVGLSDAQLANRYRDAPNDRDALSAEAHRRDLLAQHFPGGELRADLDQVGDDELAWCMQYARTDEILRIAAEMDRRDAVELPAPSDTGDAVADLWADRQAIDDALSPAPVPEDWGRLADDEAWIAKAAEEAAAHEDTDDDQYEAARKMTRKQHRQLYSEYAYEQELAAEEALRGQLLKPKYREQGLVRHSELWSGPARVAFARASDELINWWRVHGRLTQAEFIAQLTGIPDHRAERAALQTQDYMNRQ
jgi:hypothetical protein